MFIKRFIKRLGLFLLFSKILIHRTKWQQKKEKLDAGCRKGLRPRGLSLIIACDVRGHGEWLHRCSWLPLQLACAAYRLFAHAFHVFRLDRQTEGQTSQPG